MNDTNRSDLTELIKGLEKNEIVLPDFQREFVWTSEEKQCKLIASVLARMPIGSILLLKSKPDEYVSKVIGSRKKLDMSNISGEVEFLLDGQQRLTVLANVFSSVIHDLCPKVKELNSYALKRRYFLRVPKWTKSRDEKDWFGVHDLTFKYSDLSKDPEYLSGDLMPFIKCISFSSNDEKPYNPKSSLTTELDAFCVSQDDGYYIPLYLLVQSEGTIGDQRALRFRKIVQRISVELFNEITNYYIGLPSDERKKQFIDEMILDKNKREEIKRNLGLFEDYMESRRDDWENKLKSYLKKCVEDLALNRIIVNSDQRARAIDIYENLNLGGVSLNTFDLVMARVAKVDNDPFYDRMINNMKKIRSLNDYPIDVLPPEIKNILHEEIENQTYNATIKMACYNEKKREISSKYIDVFLDVLSLYCNNKTFQPEQYKLDNIKREKILELEPEDIHEECENVCTAIDRALFFFQTRCGIRRINEINYSLMIVLVATLFMKDEYYSEKKVHDKLEAWYWTWVFSGEYDNNQNAKMISNLQMMVKTLQNKQDDQWIKNNIDNILSALNFSDKSLLLMKKVKDDRYPKDVVKQIICQYFLAKTYSDMFDANKTISVFFEDADELEAHHIIPLGSVTKVGESASELRNKKDHICNSSLNFVFITKGANKKISDEPVNTYAKKLCDEARAALLISQYNDILDTDDKIEKVLAQRYDFLIGDVKAHVKQLL